MAGHRTAECDLAEAALVATLRAADVALDAKGYCAAAEDNLIDAVTSELWLAARADLERGRGTELGGKFRAAYSSSALVVNTFVPMQSGVDIPGVGFIAGTPRLEQERSGGARGFKPTLDVVVEGGDFDLFVESKCREYLDAREAAFSVAWPKHAAAHLQDAAARVYGDVYAGACSYEPVDAPQLLKDILAADTTARETGRHVVLLRQATAPLRRARRHHAVGGIARPEREQQGIVARSSSPTAAGSASCEIRSGRSGASKSPLTRPDCALPLLVQRGTA